jgi:hypothetical protein
MSNTRSVVEKLMNRFEISKKDMLVLLSQCQITEVTNPLLEGMPNETQHMAKSIRSVKDQIHEIVSDPDFGDPVLGSNVTKHAELKTRLERIQANTLYSYALNDNNHDTYQPPRLG